MDLRQIALNEQDHIIESFAEMASRYERLMNRELNLFWGIDYHSFVREVINEIEIDDTSHILDVATGTAFIPRFLNDEKKAENFIIGLDLTFEMLRHAKETLSDQKRISNVELTCASAHAMPFRENSFDAAICCLATHHMSVATLLQQMNRAIKPGGQIFIGDVGGSSRWKIGLVRKLIKSFAFIYFLFSENLSRAKAESQAVANVLDSGEWRDLVKAKGFMEIRIREIQSRRFWTPNPIIITAIKTMEANK